MDPQSITVEERIAWIASRQRGIVTWGELRAAGISATEIRHRIRIGYLIPLHRGVYRVGHRAWSVEADYLAAVKACGDSARLAGLAGAQVWSLLAGTKKVPPPEVVTPTVRRRPGIVTRRRRIHPSDGCRHRGIPILTVPAILVDIAPVLSLEPYVRACHEAHVKHGIGAPAVEKVLERRPTAPKAAVIRSVVHGDEPVLLGELEKGFFVCLKAEGFPLPDTNRRVDGRYVDCRWTDIEPPVTIELLGYRFHSTRYAWEEDHERRRAAQKRGDAFAVFTWRDVFEDSCYMLSELGRLLGGVQREPRVGRRG